MPLFSPLMLFRSWVLQTFIILPFSVVSIGLELNSAYLHASLSIPSPIASVDRKKKKNNTL